MLKRRDLFRIRRRKRSHRQTIGMRTCWKRCCLRRTLPSKSFAFTSDALRAGVRALTSLVPILAGRVAAIALYAACSRKKAWAIAGSGMARPEDQRKLQTALSLHQAGQLDKAAELYRQLIVRDQNNCYALHYLGLIEAARGNFPQAGTLLQRSLSGNPPNIQFVENYATVLFQTADYKSALELAERGLNLNKSSAALLYIGAISLFKLERYEESVPSIRQALGAGAKSCGRDQRTGCRAGGDRPL